MRKSHKRLIASIASIACLLILVLAVGGTIAYMTDAESVENTVTVGNVRIALREPDFPGNGNPGTVDLVPMETVPKNPQVKNVGVNDAIVFLRVEIPKAYVTLETETGFEPQQYRELFSMLNLDTGSADGWLQLQRDDTDEEKCVYVFAYKNKLASKDTTSALFDQVQFNNVIEQEVDRTTQNILINAYAIQADDIPDVDTSALTQETLAKIYDVYMNQSGSNQSRERSYLQTIRVRYENLDGSFGDYQTVYEQWSYPGETVQWAFEETVQWQAVSVNYEVQSKNQETLVTVYRQTYWLDLNAWYNGGSEGNTKPYGRFDLYVNGELMVRNGYDYCALHKYGTTYEVTNVCALDGYEFQGFRNGESTGYVGEHIIMSEDGKKKNSVHLVFRKVS